MARQVVIGDLVVKVGVDSKSASREMKKLKKSFEQFDKASTSNAKEKLKHTKDTTTEAEKAAKAADKQRRKAARERAAVERHQKRVLKYRQKAVSMASGAASSVAAGTIGGIGAAGAVAGAGALAAKNQLRVLRVAENVHRVSLLNRGMTEEEIQESRDRLYRRNLNYGIDPASVIKTVGDFAATMSASTGVIEDFVSASGIISKVYGLNQQQMGGFFTGSRQFFSGATDWDNVKQLFENVGLSAKELADALGVTQAEFLKQGAEGNIRDLVASAGGIEKVFIKLTQEMTDTALTAFDKVEGTLPIAEDIMVTQIQNAARIVGDEMEDSFLMIFNDISNWLRANGPAVKAFGEAMGIGLDIIWTSLKEFMEPFQPFIDEWVAAWNKMDEATQRETIQEMIDTIVEVAKGMAAVYGILKVLDFMTEVAKLKRAYQILRGGTSAAGATAAAAGAGGGSRLAALAPLAGSIATGAASALYSSPVGEGSDIVDPNAQPFQQNLSSMDKRVHLAQFRGVEPSVLRAMNQQQLNTLWDNSSSLDGSNVSVTIQDTTGNILLEGQGETTILTVPTAD